MKKITFIYVLAFLFFFCTGCVENKTSMGNDLPIVVAAKRSIDYAKKDRVDLAQYTVLSIAGFDNAQTSVIDRASSHELDVAVLRKLYKQQYWEVCYGHVSPDVAGAMYCYYLDKSEYGLLAAYRMK
jgi:hypothetical protein